LPVRATLLAAVAVIGLAPPLAAQEAEARAIPYLLQAVDGDAPEWTAAVRRCVDQFGPVAVADRHAVDGLGFVLRAEEVRPAGPDVPIPDAQARDRIRELLRSADTYLGRS